MGSMQLGSFNILYSKTTSEETPVVGPKTKKRNR